MTLRRVWLALPFVALLSGGCGTVHNLNPTVGSPIKGPGHPAPPRTTRVYGGVRNDWTGLTSLNWGDEYSFLNFVVLPFYVADLPLSLVGDTVTLPYTAVHALFCQRIARPDTTEAGKQPHGPPGRGTGVGGEASSTDPNAPPSGDPPSRNVFAPLAGNRFDSWTMRRTDFASNR